jgi:RNA polymerase sigma-70 factor, ECF subfamily
VTIPGVGGCHVRKEGWDPDQTVHPTWSYRASVGQPGSGERGVSVLSGACLGGIPARPGPWSLLWSASTPTAKPLRGAHVARSPRQLEADDERLLIARVRGGDREAYGALVEQHLDRALALGIRLLHHRQDAEDLTQDAFLLALQHLDAFDEGRPFWPWLSRIIVNRGLDLAAARAVRVTEPLPEAALDPRQGPAEAAERSEILSRFRHELALLPPRRKLVVQLFELDGYSVAEIAELLDTSRATVRWHLHAARHQLRRALAHFRGGDR